MLATPERNISRPWSEEEGEVLPVLLAISPSRFFPDKLLTEAVKTHGERDNWKNVALSVPGRSNKACRKVTSPFQT